MRSRIAAATHRRAYEIKIAVSEAIGGENSDTMDAPARTTSLLRFNLFRSESLARLTLLFVIALVILYGVVYPNFSVLTGSLQQGGAWSFGNYTAAFAQRSVIEAMWTSICVSLLTVMLCALVGVPLAFLFERYDFPARRVFGALAALPLVLPPLVGTIAFIFLCGESGILARLVQRLFQLQSAPWKLRGWTALLLFHTYTMYPFFYVLTGAGLRRIDAGLQEAARSIGASSRVVLWRVVLPQLTPSLIAAALLTFMTSMASFSAPLLFGGVRVLTLEIYNARQRGDTAAALTETVILAFVSLCALLFFQKYEGTRRFAAAAMKGATKRRAQITNGAARSFAIIAGIVFSILLVLPVAVLALVSFAEDGTWTIETLPPAYTIANYARIFTDEASRAVFINSVLMAGIASGAALVWSFCVAEFVTARGNRFVRRAVSLLVLVPWALPGTVVAVAIAEAYGKPNPLMGSFVLVGTFWILPVIYFLRFMPLVVRALQASVEQLDASLDEAARVSGARFWQRFWRVRLPLVGPGAMAGALLAFVIALGEYVASVLVFVPRNRPVSIAIAAELRNFNLGTAAAYGVVLIVVISISMIVAARLERSTNY